MGMPPVKYTVLLDDHVTGKLIPPGSLLKAFAYHIKNQEGILVTSAHDHDNAGYIWNNTWHNRRDFTEDDLLVFVAHVNGGYFGGKFNGVVLWKEKFYAIQLAAFQVVSVNL